tara:strand:- start:5557 stop:5682 length:126 start_codon:yes stop_codon:yes gene_type:complete
MAYLVGALGVSVFAPFFLTLTISIKISAVRQFATHLTQLFG